ncbi:restriction endonuclease subunit S [Aliarcobacter butzleri]|uniref:restriction endonuclease subunit S n=1 Tax=Aliarcobacter butzleri TaxID=28197 RepID=UPI0021B1C803|nr:restriction endonuclease subunit S [Aliarcobacter butzleri]MCT7613109.1 restriction endonuclease subunit S [Aliarcobacter butzleri]MCT7641743.1 restriction endonuclease subunit S [Aliarcobacter butzleri]
MSKLPKGWEEEQLKDIVYKNRAITYGIVQPGGDISPLGIPLIRGKDYSSGKVNLTGLYHVSEEIDRPYSRSKVKENDILLTIVGYVGQTAIVPKELENANITQTTARISVNHEIANYQFVDYFLNSNLGQKNLKRYEKGSAQAGLNLKDIEKVKIFLPPLEEQKKIADILGTVDKKIAFVEENINATEELKKGLMQKLLTEGISHTEFKDSELGRIPESWEVVQIKQLGLVVTGSTPKTANKEFYENGTRLWASPSDLGKSKEIKNTATKLSDLGFEQTRILPPRSILITCIGSTIGKIGIAYEEMSTNQQINSVVCNEKNNSDFYYYVLDQQKEYIKKLAGTQAVPLLNKTDFSMIKVIQAPLEEQKQIAEILSTVDNKLENLKEKKQSFEELKKGLMQKLLTGEVRV